MKIKNILILVLPILLFSCSPQAEEVEYVSENGKVTVSVSGARQSSLDPWDIALTINAYEKSRTLNMDMYNSAVDKTTTTMEWDGNNAFTLTLKQSDGDNRVMDVVISDIGEVQLLER